MFGKINQRGITWKIRKGAQSFLCATHHCDPIHTPIKLHEDIPKDYCVMVHTRILEKLIKGITWKLREGEQSFEQFW